MADKKISALTSATTPLAGTEVLPVVQSGATVKVSVENLTKGRPVEASKVSVGTTSTTSLVNIGVGTYSAPAANTTGVYSDATLGLVLLQADGKYYFANSSGTSLVTIADVGGSVGALTIPNGNLVIGTSGKGIDFSADPSAAGMTSELLDDYEEGTWTPKDAVGANLTITGTAAYYRKVGSIVTITFDVTWTADTTPTLTNLPFSNLGSHAGGCFAFNTTAAVASLLILNGTTTADIYNGIGTSPNPALKRFVGSFVYQTA